MRNFTVSAVLSLTVLTTPLAAQDNKLDQLFDVLDMPAIIDVMRLEGLAYGTTLADDMLPGGATADWDATVSQIYDAETMIAEVRGDFVASLEGADVDAMLAFYQSDLGAKVVELETAARRALLDDDVTAASIEAAELARMDETPRFLLAQTFIEENNLIDGNVEGSLNSAYAFYTGLIDGGAMPAEVTVESALDDIWAQEPEMRANAEEWLFSFVLMAYQPLSEDEFAELTAFTQTDAGAEMTDALFTSFNGMFAEISRAMGLAISQSLLTQEL